MIVSERKTTSYRLLCGAALCLLLAIPRASADPDQDSSLSGATDSSTNSPASATTPASAIAALGTRLVEIRAIGSEGHWLIGNQTPDQILDLVKKIRTALGTPFTLYDFIDGYQNPDSSIDGMSMDDYLTEIQRAAGGPIVPMLNLDFYINPYENNKYRTPDGSLGPDGFWKVSSSLLSLKAIGHGPRVALLASWETMHRKAPNPKYSDPDTIDHIFRQILARGWTAVIPDDIGPFFPDHGLGAAVDVGVSFPKGEPWMEADPRLVADARKEPQNPPLFVQIDTQHQICPKQCAMDIFLAKLTTAQKQTSLEQLAKNQATGRYLFVYPFWLFADSPRENPCDDFNDNPGYWDATSARLPQGSDALNGSEGADSSNESNRSNGTTFFDLIIRLMKQYN